MADDENAAPAEDAPPPEDPPPEEAPAEAPPEEAPAEAPGGGEEEEGDYRGSEMGGEEEEEEEQHHEEEVPVMKKLAKPTRRKKSAAILSAAELLKMAMQSAKDDRNERAGYIGTKHQYVMAQVADILNVTPETVQDGVIDDMDYVESFDEFFEADGSFAVGFLWLELKPPNLDTGRYNPAWPPEDLMYRIVVSNLEKGNAFTGHCVIAYRLSNEKTIEMRTINDEIFFMSLNIPPGGTIIGAIHQVLEMLTQPLLHVMKEWGPLSTLPPTHAQAGLKKDFLDNYDDFIKFLKMTKIDLDGRLFFEVDKKYYNKYLFDSYMVTENSNYQEHMRYTRGYVREWAKQIQNVVVMAGQIRRESDTLGPMAELEYWRRMLARYGSVVEFQKTRVCKMHIMMCTLTKCKIMKRWRELDNQMTDAFNEAADNVKYLYSLEKYLEPLYRLDPTEIPIHLQPLMFTIRMVYTTSKFYNTTERATALLSKITNQLIVACKAYLNLNGTISIWSIPKAELAVKIQKCFDLYKRYHDIYYETCANMLSTPGETPFECSRTILFGRFEHFNSRLEKILDICNVYLKFSVLQSSTIEDIDAYANYFTNMFLEMANKKYDPLAHRLTEFDRDYLLFKQKQEKYTADLKAFVGYRLSFCPTVEVGIILLKRFEKLKLNCLRLDTKFMELMDKMLQEIEVLKDLYNERRQAPPMPRNVPPVTGRIMWVRMCYVEMEAPMEEFKQRESVITNPKAQPCIKQYNCLAGVFMHYEMLYHKAWVDNVDLVKHALTIPLLIRDSVTSMLEVQFNNYVHEVIRETEGMWSLGLDVPDTAHVITYCKDKINNSIETIKKLMKRNDQIRGEMPRLFLTMLRAQLMKLDDAWRPALSTITWTSMKISSFCTHISKVMDEVYMFVKQVRDLKEAQLDEVMATLMTTKFVFVPDEPLTPEAFVQANKEYRISIEKYLQTQSYGCEKATIELVNKFIDDIIPYEVDMKYDWMDYEEVVKPVGSVTATVKKYTEFKEINESNIRRELKNVHMDAIYIFAFFSQKMAESLVKAARASLEYLRQRATHNNPLKPTKKALMITQMELHIPKAIITPTLEEINKKLQEVIQNVLITFKAVKAWGFLVKQKPKRSPDGKLMKVEEPTEVTYYRTICDHKDTLRGVLNLSQVILDIQPEVDNLLDSVKQYAYLWAEDRDDQITNFVASNPLVTDIRERFREYDARAAMLNNLPDSYQIGNILIETTKYKLGLVIESNAWKTLFGKLLIIENKKKLVDMFNFINEKTKILAKPLNDLDDVRAGMLVLESVRDNFIRLDMSLALMEETYGTFMQFNVDVPKEDLDKIDSLRYNFKTMLASAGRVQDCILNLQGKLLDELNEGVSGFLQDVIDFDIDYEARGPMIPGLAAREASDRVLLFQAKFDELWRRYEMYQSGEKLFGLPINDYPILHKRKKEFNLLSKLYTLYLQVNKSIDGYFDCPWSEVDTDIIIAELTEFQNRCRKLPKAMKDWPAFIELKNKIDDFNETCPLLELMANKAMKDRHWVRLENLTKCKFDIDNPAFTLRSVMEAPLLKHKDDVEDICISAVKEKDIEAKLKQIMSDWTVVDLQFAPFKNRGELLVKGAETGDIITLLEDSLMVLNSLLSNRYNAPFKKDIQLWVWKLVTTTEILEKWLIVQNLWTYLEAVFVGGDIAKQLPAEAKRFSQIDKTWVRIMYRARDTPNVINCCVGDETMIQLLPFLLDQLETCQKSLTGYLENKRLSFPRFFFISDPVLLEILGQSSDPHTIQPHLLSLFDAVAKVQFDDKIYEKIIAICSCLDECVPLEHPVICIGGVEIWVSQLLYGMMESIRGVIGTMAANFDDPDFDFVAQFPAFCGQAGLLGVQLLWTKEAEFALRTCSVDKTIMRKTNQRFLDILNHLIELTILDLSKIDRIRFETMVTIHVHQRDIFDEMVVLRVKNPIDFEWQKQARFYFYEETDECFVKITDVDFLYQCEYLGVTERLAVTPLTDRCYVTLSQAIGMHMGGAPAGPAGTGKTETTKDMGRALGKFVVVFNCSDQMDFRGLGRIYKGLAQSGSWGCFDEFNRIELPVLSVAAQQIFIVLNAKKEHKPFFLFSDGDTVSMNEEFGLFLTMNPGYAGRQELPENLKIMFRTVSMMVPDRQIIIRVKLASCGFKENVPLARKFFVLYALCEEQLSKQVHYDFGLRNILSVLRTMGAQKRANPDYSEENTLMRVLRDMNLSKLVDEDEPLFLSLIEDMFPGIKLSTASYKDLQKVIARNLDLMGLINHAEFNLKLVQLYETSLVRHGLMTMGPTGSGKTMITWGLCACMTDMGRVHKELRMNPKAITAAQMFGRLDAATNDWTDGIFSTLWRRTLKMKKSDFVWLILDGPVDAVWIENLNSVLDDNKTLTLANGDRIVMAANAKLVFEPDNVDNASPATVSRVGMVFISSSVLKWQPFLEGWFKTRKVNSEIRVLSNCFAKSYDALHTLVQTKLKPKMIILEAIYVRQCTDLLTGLLNYEVEEPVTMSDKHLERLYIFSVMWSLGAALELEDRQKMADVALKIKMDWPKLQPEETIFEYVVNEEGQWQHWNERVEQYMYPTDSVPEYAGILVPNVDNTRSAYLIHTIAKQKKAVLLIGEQGTAKTVMLKGYMALYDPEEHLFKSFNFSFATTPNMVQRIIESYVDKRVGTTYGPPGLRRMTVFIDDINMPVFNDWGDQVTNEIVRQLMATGGFYSLEKPGEFSTIQDIQLVAAMIHPGGGRNDIPPRLKRQFNVFNCTLPSNKSMDLIFSTMGEGYFCVERFDQEIVDFIPQLIPLTRIVWQATKVKMLPTPAKFHYVFNLRDLSRIWEGILKIERLECPNPFTVLKLWKHECTRVISDRFVTYDDRNWFLENMRRIAEDFLKHDYKFYPTEETWFVDFLREPLEATGDEPEDFSFDAPKVYEELPSMEFTLRKIYTFMGSFNENVRGFRMDMVFFHDALVHLIIISRIIRTPRGNALLVGVGGSGKQSLTRLASYIADFKFYQITLTRSYSASNLQEDFKYLYRTAGLQGQGISFIFTDNDIKDEGFLEFLNNVLSSGEIANLFAKDELDEITSELIPIMKKLAPKRIPTVDNLYDYFIIRSRFFLHIVLCFSPVGEKFRNRSLKFPGLISGCTMDWFQKWPHDALVAVSKHFLGEFDVVCTPQIKYDLIEIMGWVQDGVSDVCITYYERFRRQTYVTPKSFLSFLEGYKKIYKSRHENIALMAYRMNTGLVKLVEAAASVDVLKKELEEKDKVIAVASAKAEVVLQSVARSQKAAEIIKVGVIEVKEKAEALVEVISAETAIAEAKLEVAKPALAAAEAALLTIKAADIATVRKLGKPPYLITLIMDAVLILFKKRVDPVKPDPEKQFLTASWNDSLKLMSDTRFLANLVYFPKDEITAETVDLLTPYLGYSGYTYAAAKQACGNVAGLISWTMAMALFYGINKDVLPLKANLAKLQGKLEKAQTELASAQALLDQKEAELAVVQAEFDTAMALRQEVLDDAAICQGKMDAATALIDGLSGERIRWTEQSALFKSEIERLVGDVLLLTGFLSYSGPFNQEFRSFLEKSWCDELQKRKMPFTLGLNIVDCLVDSATVGEWNLQGLPNDELSVQNGIIVTKADRYPLLIDPQSQGKFWISNKEKENSLIITTLTHKYFRNHMEDAVSLGYPLLIVDIAEELDPSLDNVLEKNFIKMGNSYKVKVGDKEVDVCFDFRLYITTKLPNPKYTPEVSARTSMIDFTVTMKGLEDQLLGRVILTEKRELETERVQLVMDVTANKRKMQELEANLLYKLTTTQGSLVEDATVLGVLNVTKATATEVKEKLQIASETEVKINSAREEFRPVATRGSVLYFLITTMTMVNSMYQTSLNQFLERFDLSMERSEKSPINMRRIGYIIDYLTYEIFRYTCRGLYEEHKYLFVLMMTLKIDVQKENVSYEEFQTFIKGGAALDLNACPPKPAKWITDMTWLNLVQLSYLRHYQYILQQVTNGERQWKNWFDKDAPEEEVIPDGYNNLDAFRRLLIVRAWCPDRTLAQSRKYISSSMGGRFAEPVILQYESMLEESRPLTPLICFLSMGSDPTPNISSMAVKNEILCSSMSMGQGQEIHARKLLATCIEKGEWALLQNCHLGLDYMNELMVLLLDIEKEELFVHPMFRVWVTTEPHPQFPITLLQMSIKFTNEPPSGIRAGLMRTYQSMDEEMLEYLDIPQYLPMIYGVSFLHTVVQERRKFGPLGWNIPYEFNSADWYASCLFVQNHLDVLDPKRGISWLTVRYMFGEIQYGGRVTDDYDKRLLNTFAKVWFHDNMFNEDFCFYKGYKILKFKSQAAYLQAFDGFAPVDPPQVYGLHSNADITYQSNATTAMLDTIVSIQPKEAGGGGGESREAAVTRMTLEMISKLPPDYDPYEVKERLRIMGILSSMNIFLRQEIDQMQKILHRVRVTLKDLLLAIEGTIIMNESLTDALDNIYDARVPSYWKRGSWVSSTLGFWFTELLERNQQFSTWCFKGRPMQFWMTGFFNPQGFLTAMKQEVVRAHKGWPLDLVSLSNSVTKNMREEVVGPPPEGVYVYGLFLDGAGWDRRTSRVVEAINKVLYTIMPVVHVTAINSTAPKDPALYMCPVYKKPTRTGLMYITPLWLQTSKPPDHWTLRGCALLCDIK